MNPLYFKPNREEPPTFPTNFLCNMESQRSSFLAWSHLLQGKVTALLKIWGSKLIDLRNLGSFFFRQLRSWGILCCTQPWSSSRRKWQWKRSWRRGMISCINWKTCWARQSKREMKLKRNATDFSSKSCCFISKHLPCLVFRVWKMNPEEELSPTMASRRPIPMTALSPPRFFRRRPSSRRWRRRSHCRRRGSFCRQ